MIHESAYVEEAVIGQGTKIWHFVHVRQGAKIGKNCIVGKGVYIDTNVQIGDNCKIQNFASLYQGLTIGNNVFIGPHVCFTNDIYPRAYLWDDQRLTKTRVKDGASLGANATIVAGVTIGKFSMVGAGTVVTHDIPNYGLVIGNPGKLIGFVCECGTRLQIRDTKNKDRTVGICPQCLKEIEIDFKSTDESKK